MKKTRPWLYVVLSILLILVFFVSLAAGSTVLDPGMIFVPGSPDSLILFSIRLPRTAAAALAGLALALSGLLVQSATGNPLASSNIIGINSGAGFAVMLILSLAPSMFGILPLAAFSGALASALLVFLISGCVSSLSSASSLILSGVAVNAFFNALISIVTNLDPDAVSGYSAFSAGGFALVSWSDLVIPSILILLASASSFLMTGAMDALLLGDEIASSLGYRPRKVRIMLMALSCLLAASAVSFCGLLGFVGLVTPHIARFLTGGKSVSLISVCALAGPVLVMLADLLGRTLFAPSELPAGIFMALLGVPFFIVLLLRRRR